MTNLEIELCMRDLVFKDDDTIIFPSENFNGLFSASIKTGKAHLIGTFPGEEMYKQRLYRGAHKYKHYILFVPAVGRHLLVYDMDKDAFQSILDKGASPSIFKYGASIMVNKYVYIFGGDNVPEILRIDMENFQVKYYEGWLEKICRYGEKKEKPYFYNSVCLVNNSLFAVTGQSNSILELDMQNDNIYIHSIGEKEDIFKALAWDGESFLLMDQAQNIIRADIKKGSFQYLKIENHVIKNWFSYSIVMGDEVWFVSNSGNIVKINGNSIVNSRLETEFYGSEQRENWYVMVKKVEKGLAFFSGPHYELHLFERGRGIKKIKILWEDPIRDYYDKYPKEYYHLEHSKDSKNYILYENIETFIQYIKSTNNINVKEIKKSNIGKRTYDLIAYNYQSEDQ